jgi:hypothetical protein
MQIAASACQAMEAMAPDAGPSDITSSQAGELLDANRQAVVDIELVPSFESGYSRNNKSKLKKHLRCFPSCSLSGHVHRGFCGNSVHIKVSSSVLSNSELKSLIIVGGIRCSIDKPATVVGASLESAAFGSFLEKNKLLQGLPIYQSGEFANVFEISPGRQGWNYLADINRCRGKACHSFWVGCFVVVPHEPHEFLWCAASVSSSEFTVASSKKKGEQKARENPTQHNQLAPVVPETLTKLATMPTEHTQSRAPPDPMQFTQMLGQDPAQVEQMAGSEQMTGSMMQVIGTNATYSGGKRQKTVSASAGMVDGSGGGISAGMADGSGGGIAALFASAADSYCTWQHQEQHQEQPQLPQAQNQRLVQRPAALQVDPSADLDGSKAKEEYRISSVCAAFEKMALEREMMRR